MNDTQTHYSILALIMFFSGLLGGIANYLIISTENIPDTEVVPSTKPLLIKSVLLGIIAAFMVPLFLTTISSELLKPASGNEFNKNYLVLTGFCLIAAVLSKQFIENLSQKILKVEKKAAAAVNKANETVQRVESIENSLTEDEPLLDHHPNRSIIQSIQEPGIDNQIINIINASKYVYRTQSGIIKDLGTSNTADIIEELERMVQEGKLESRLNAKGKKIYKVSRR